MAKRLLDIDAAIAAGEAPRAPKRSRGLLLNVAGGRPRRLITEGGKLTADGRYYYEKTGQQAPDAGFDRTQAPTRRGAREQIKLLNGSTASLRIWDNIERQWRFTKLGHKYYGESLDRYVVTFPVRISLLRINNTTYTDVSVLKSTAVSLGEITVPRTMSDEQQLAEVKRRTMQFLASLELDDNGQKVLVEGGGSSAHVVLDEENDKDGRKRENQYNREEILAQPDGSLTVAAVLHRPLRAARPWSFGFAGVCPEAFDETDGRCVPHQLEAVLARTLGLKEADMDWLFDEIAAELYPPGSEDSPFELELEDGSIEQRSWRQCGITVAMIQRFAEEHRLSVHSLFGKSKVLSFTPEDAVGSLCLHVYGDHAFFVDDPQTKSTIAKLKVTKPQLRPDTVLTLVPKNADPPASEWRPWPGGALSNDPGHYFVYDDLGPARLALHAESLCPQVLLNAKGLPKTLRFRTKAGNVVIHKRNSDSAVCQAFSTEFEAATGTPLPWKGESLATFLFKAFEATMNPAKTRKQLTEEQRQSIWEEQGSVCRLCGAAAVPEADREVDHISPISVGGIDGLENLQVLCKACHLQKTQLETLSFVEEPNVLLSRFSVEAHKAFVKQSAKPPQLVANLHEKEGGGAISVDVRRCRFNAFVEADAYDVPIFSPLDAPVPTVPGELGDYMLVDKGPLGPKESALSVLPYHGSGYYGRASVAFMLDAGIAKWADIKKTFSASAHRPMKLAAEALGLIERILLKIGATFEGQAFLESRGCRDAGPEMLAKYGSVSLLGVMSIPDQFRYKLETTSCSQDILADSASVSPTPGSPQEHGVPVFWDYITKQRVLSLASMRPLHQHCLEQEYLQVARAVLIIRRWTRIENILSLRVDEVFCYVPRAVQDRFKAEIEAVRYDTLHTILPKGRKAEHQKANSSTASVYRVKFAEAAIYPGGSLELRAAPEAEEEEQRPREWSTVEEPLEGPDDFTQQIVERAVAGNSFCVLGAAGTGKSVCLRAVKAALEEQGLHCQCIALTHTAARNIGPDAKTAHGFAMRQILHGSFSGQVVLVDEISFMSVDLLAALEHLRLKGVRIICFGDFGQLPPIRNRWRGCEVPADAFEKSELFLNWSEGTRFVLRRCRRSDQAHFDFYTSLRDRPVREALAAARARYPARAEGACTWNITMSNWRRKKINEKMQRRAAEAVPEAAKALIEGEGVEVPYHLFAGTRLIGSNTVGKFVNGAFLVVLELGSETARLQDEDTQEEFEVRLEQIAKHCRLRWALTLCSVQGRSLRGTIMIHDTESCFFSSTHLYVALSRAVDGGSVWIA